MVTTCTSILNPTSGTDGDIDFCGIIELLWSCQTWPFGDWA